MPAPTFKIVLMVIAPLFLTVQPAILPAFSSAPCPGIDSKARMNNDRRVRSERVDSRHLELIGRWAHGPCYAVAARGDTVVFASGGRLEIYDFSDPLNPNEIGHVTPSAVPHDIHFSSDYIYATSRLNSLVIIDISDPTIPVEVGSWNEGDWLQGVAQAGEYAYVIDNFGLHVIDVADPANPHEIGSYYSPYINMDVAVSGNYVYMACDEGGLLIIDVTDPANPHLEGICGTVGLSWGVAVQGSYAYVAEYNASLRVIDISNPGDPREVGSCITGGNGQAVRVSGGYAYVAVGTSGLRIVNVSNPESPAVAGYRDSNDLACDVAISGTYAFVAERYEGLRVLDSADPATIKEVWHHDKGGCAVNVAVSGTHAYVADSKKALRILNTADPSNPEQVGYFEFDDAVSDVAIQGGYAYVGVDNTTDGFHVIDIGDPANPGDIGHFNTGWGATGVAVSGNFAYVTDISDGLRVIDISDPAHPGGVGRCDIRWAEDVSLIGSYAYVVNGWGGGLHIVDVSNSTNPTEVSYYAMYDAMGVAASGDFAYVTDGDTFRVIDVSDPTNPKQVGRCGSGYPIFDYTDVAIHGGLVFVATASPGVQIIDVSAPKTPHVVGYYETGDCANGIAISSDDHVYVADEDDGIYILYSPLVATLLQYYSTSIERGAVIIEWMLSEKVPIDEISISRRTLPDDWFVTVNSPAITSAASHYRFEDVDCEPGSTYLYRVYLEEAGEERLLVETDPVTVPPASLTLCQNYPNPFNPATTIRYNLPDRVHVMLGIYDSAGRKIACIVDGNQEAGFHSVQWDGRDASGAALSSGIYFYRLTAGKETISRKMLLLR